MPSKKFALHTQLTFVASEVGQQPRLNSPGCSSPVASEEVPESVSSERDCGDERLEHGHVETPETGRKRKHSTNSNGPNYGVRQKDLKISGDSVVPIEQRDKKVETGSSQMKVLLQQSLQKYTIQYSYIITHHIIYNHN